jgi:uncharacterized protein (TIGR02391 family)
MEANGLEQLLRDVEQLKRVLIAVSTGGPRIQEKEAEYGALYRDIALAIERLQGAGLGLKNPNPFRTLWDWYAHYSANLPQYVHRRQYVSEMYGPLVAPLEAALHRHRVEATPPAELARDLQRRVHSPDAVPSFELGFASIHPKVREQCQVPFETGRYDDAILNAMKVVEAEIRALSGSAADDVGVGLVTKAMKPGKGSVVVSEVEAEQEAAHSLYRGAIGLLKNPHSHRFVNVTDPVLAFETLAFASLLMRVLAGSTGR